MKKLILALIVIGLIVGGFTMLSWPGSVLFSMLTLFPYFKNNLIDSGMVTPWVANFVAFLFTFAVAYGGYNLFKFNKYKRIKGIITLCICFCVFYIFLNFTTKNRNFNPNNGDSLVNISDTPEGAKIVPKSWRYDVIYGNRTVPANQENIVKVVKPD